MVSLSLTISQSLLRCVHWLSDAIQLSHSLLPSSPLIEEGKRRKATILTFFLRVKKKIPFACSFLLLNSELTADHRTPQGWPHLTTSALAVPSARMQLCLASL